MSPSRIPRPGVGGPPSPLGPNAEHHRLSHNGHGNGSGVRSAQSPSANFSPNSSGFKPHPAFIQPRPLNLALSPPTQHNPRLPPVKRRPKPPSPDMEDGPIQPTTPSIPSPNYQSGNSPFRRPAPPPVVNVGSPESGLPRPARSAFIGVGNGTPGGQNGSPRSCLRQPSTPSFSAARENRDQKDAKTQRSRASSAAADTRNTQPAEIPPPPMPLLFAPSFAESREPSVPPHIRVRLRLIHRLGVVLGIDAAGISSKLDVPGLLARVDAAYDRGHQALSMAKEGSATSVSSVTSGLPISNRPVTEDAPLAASKGSESIPKVRGEKPGMLGMLKRFGRGPVKEERIPVNFTSTTSEGPAFGVSLNEAPPGAWCTSLIGGQKHELPLVVFTIVEEIYRRGMSQPGIFRLAGDGTRISHLTKVFNLPPLYGDSLSIASEPIHNLTGLVKRYIRDLPEPILDESLFPAFLSFCAEPDNGDLPLSTRIHAAQLLLKLLPPLHFSLLIYLLAFLGQLPLFPDNRLNVESISIIFGPAMCAVRGKGISGLGPSVTGRGGENDPEEVSNLVNQSQSCLAWLLRNWSAISDKVLDPPFEEEGEEKKEGGGGKVVLDPRLLSPIDLRRSNTVLEGSNEQSPFRGRARGSSVSRGDQPETREPRERERERETNDTTARSSNTEGIASTTATPTSAEVCRDDSTSTSTTTSSDTAVISTPPGGTSSCSISASPSSSSGIFARAFSSMSIASQAREPEETKVPKRSASFTSLSSLVRKGGALMRGDQRGRDERERRVSQDESRPTVNPQIHNVLGSLHDLLVSKDKQIERDARELALLRHTLLEMDEKLSRSRCSNCTNSTDNDSQPPAITITSTVSSTSLANKEKEILEMQTQVTTALAALETARLQSRKQAERTLELEAKLARADSEKRLEMGKLEVALALEQAKVGGLIEERDIARDRLEKVRTTLFAVA